jgi:hypothetical protein
MALKAGVTNPPVPAMVDLLPSPLGRGKASGERNGLVGSNERERTRDLEREKRGKGVGSKHLMCTNMDGRGG